MRWISTIALAMGLLASIVLLDRASSPDTRFRITIEIETPDGVRSGSSIIETKSSESSLGSGPWSGVNGKAKGQAIFIDLGAGKNLIGLLGWGPVGSDCDRIFELTRAALAPRGIHLGWKQAAHLRGKGQLPADYIPTLITFSNLADPRTARVVDPSMLANVFGPGFLFLGAYIETTDDPIVFDIDKKLPWWNEPGRPAEIAYLSWRSGINTGQPLVPEACFFRK